MTTRELSSDIESVGNGPYLLNEAAHSFSWTSLDVGVYDKKTRGDKAILSDIQGCVKAGMHPRFPYTLTVCGTANASPLGALICLM